MIYHIDTGLILEKFATDSECPLCEIEKKAEEQFLYEFLNDAVMEDSTRKKVNEKGFCKHHFDLLFKGQNKLSLALQTYTRTDYLLDGIKKITSEKDAKKQIEFLNKNTSSCIICELLNESMEKYYKGIAQMFAHEKEFKDVLLNTKGFCIDHYKKLLEFSHGAGLKRKEYLEILSELQIKNLNRVQKDVKDFCDIHDYRNAYKPLGNAETALPRAGIKLYGKK